jgi:hypothetical protein
LNWGRYAHVSVFRHAETVLLAAFTANCFLVTTWAFDSQKSWKESVDIAKWFLVYVCIVKTHSDRKWLWVILAIYLLAAIHVGWDVTLHPKGGRRVDAGPATAYGDNPVSAHVVALLPFLALYAVSSETNRWFRAMYIAGAPLMLNVIAHASSRGAMLAMATAGLTMVAFSRGRLRAMTVLCLLVGALLGARLFHEQFWNRMETISPEKEDGSKQLRLVAWQDAWRAAKANPLGYGGEAFDAGVKTQSLTTMNIFFEVLVAWGWQGVVLFFGFIFFAMWDCWKLRAKLWQPDRWPPRRDYLDTVALLAGLCSMLVASIFMNRLRWELWWVFGAYILCLKNIVREDEAREAGMALQEATSE